MRRPAFKVSGVLVCVLSGLGFLRHFTAPMLPPSAQDKRVTRPTNQQPPAPVVEIGWRTNVVEAQKEAAQRRRMLLYFIAAPTSRAARTIEEDTLTKPEIVRFIRQHFVPVQINSDEYPEWDQLLFPLARTRGYSDPGLVLLATTHQGVPIESFLVNQASQYLGFEAIQRFLVRSKSLGIQFESRAPERGELAAVTAAELEFLQASSTQRLPSPGRLLEMAARGADPGTGLFQVYGFWQPRPLLLRLMARSGQINEAANLAKRQIESPLYDVLDGGFFRSMYQKGGAWIVDTSKQFADNALIAEVYTELGLASGDRTLIDAAKDIVRGLERPRGQGFTLRASQFSDQLMNMRSPRYSLTLRRLQSSLPERDLGWAQENLLQGPPNPQNLPRLARAELLTNSEFLRIREQLRKGGPAAPDRSMPDRVDIAAYICARLHRIASLTGDPEVLQIVKRYSPDLYASFTGDHVERWMFRGGTGWLGSYLHLADFALQDYLASGNRDALTKAVEIFRLARARFADPSGRFLAKLEPAVSAGLDWCRVPEIADPGRESTTATAMRLAWMLSFLVSESSEATEFRAFARRTALLLAEPLALADFHAAGYFVSSQLATSAGAVSIVGKGCVETALRKTRAEPLGRFFHPIRVQGEDARELTETTWTPSAATSPLP